MLARIFPRLLLAAHLLLALRLNIASAGVWAFDAQAHPIITAVAQLVGLSCTYGFFAPRVASPSYLEIEAVGRGGMDTLVAPSRHFVNNEGRLRYRSFSTLFLDLAQHTDLRYAPADTAFAKRVARAFARSIAEREAHRLGKRLIQLRVWVYRHPHLHEMKQRKQPTIHMLYEYIYPIP